MPLETSPAATPPPAATNPPATQGTLPLTPEAPPAPAAPAPPPPPAPMISLTPEQFNQFVQSQARLNQIEAENLARDRRAQEEQTRMLVEKGQAEEALRLTREQAAKDIAAKDQLIAEKAGRAKRHARDGALSQVLAGQPLADPAAAQQLAALWRNEFDAYEEGDGYVVRTPNFVGVQEFVAQKLRSPNTPSSSAPTTPAAAPPRPARPPRRRPHHRPRCPRPWPTSRRTWAKPTSTSTAPSRPAAEPRPTRGATRRGPSG